MSDGAPLVHLILPKSAGPGLHHVLSHRFVPLALMTVGALAERDGWRVRIIDENHDAIPDERPDLVGITVWTLLAPRAYRIADRYRAMGVPVLLGGVHTSMMPGEALRHADAIVVGEAEAVLREVLADCRAGRMHGIYQGPWESLDNAPSFSETSHYYDRFPAFRYWPQYSVQTARGCRFNCDYCSVIRINGRGQRHREAQAVVEALELRTKKNRLTAGLFFTDDDFGSDLDYTTELLEAMAKAKLRVVWGAQTSIGIARNEELVKLAKRAGCSFLFMGLESRSRESLVDVNKKNRPDEYKELIGRVRQHGIGVEGAFIFGLEHDGPDCFERTVDFADDIEIDAAVFNVLTPLPGTKTYAQMWDEERIVDFDWSHYSGQHAVIEPRLMTRAQLSAGLNTAFRDFYSPKRILRRYRRALKAVTPDQATIGMFIGASFRREYRRLSTWVDDQPSYTPPREELERLAIVSRSDANDALATATRLALDAFPDAARPVTVPSDASGIEPIPVMLGRRRVS